MNPQESRDSFFFIMYGLFYDSLCNRLRKDGKISVGKILKNDSDLCTQTCPYRLAKLGTSLRIRGKLTLRKKQSSFINVLTGQMSTQRTEQEMQAVSVCFT